MNTDKIYAESIAKEYAPKDNSKIVALRKLDAKADALCSQKKKNSNLSVAAIFGRGDRIRTCGPLLPKKSAPIFSLIYKAFRGF